VGHSFGGNNIQLYAATYPDEVLGMVLVDSSHEGQEKRLPPHPIMNLVQMRQSSEDMAFKEAYGIGCFMTHMYLRAKLTSLPKEMQDTHRSLSSTQKHCSTVSAESELFSESFKQLAAIDRSIIKNKPCFIISAGCETDLSSFGITREQQESYRSELLAWKSAWDDLQEDLVSKFPGARHIIAEKSEHQIHWSQPEVIVQAVKELIEESKRS